MRLIDSDIHTADPICLASTLIHNSRDRAQALVAEQVERSDSGSKTSERWLAVAQTIAIMVEANEHMELALSLLDSIREHRATISLDHAIEILGVRVIEGALGDKI